MSTSHARYLFALAALAGGLAACHSTQLAATWRDPNATQLRFSKTYVSFATKDETLRRVVEDRLAEKVPNAVQSYRLASSGTSIDSASIRKQLADQGFDSAVIMRVAEVDPNVVYASNTYWYGSRYGFGYSYGSAWGYPYDPGYYYGDRVVTIETQVYSLADDRLVWAGRSETTNPASVGKLTDSVIKHVMKALQKDGLMAGLRCAASPCDAITGSN